MYLWDGDRLLEMLAERSAECSRQCAAIETCYGHFIYELEKTTDAGQFFDIQRGLGCYCTRPPGRVSRVLELSNGKERAVGDLGNTQ